jgi:membrane protease YdiL (CAAX protease family)
MKHTSTPLTNKKPETVSLPFAIWMHLLPGILTIASFLLLQQILFKNLPSSLNFIIAILVVPKLFMWGYLFYKGFQRNGRFSLRGIIGLRTKIPKWQYIAFFFAGIVVLIMASAIFSPISDFLAHHVFGWYPHSFLPMDVDDPSVKNHALALAILLLNLVVDGFITPITEETYYRGYFLTRLYQLGWLAPAFSALFFTFQHLWQPQNMVLIFTVQLIVIYTVWWKKNYYVGMMLHCAANTIGGLLALMTFLHP